MLVRPTEKKTLGNKTLKMAFDNGSLKFVRKKIFERKFKDKKWYLIGFESFFYTYLMWFLTNYKIGNVFFNVFFFIFTFRSNFRTVRFEQRSTLCVSLMNEKPKRQTISIPRKKKVLAEKKKFYQQKRNKLFLPNFSLHL